ncbi:MAG: 3-methyl-2-oxobutanoate hydroxymethyltransferase [Gammaproteobacteria bacterium]
MTRKITLSDLQSMKAAGEKIACLTAYDATFARIVDESGMDVILVGDSLGMVVQGRENTLNVTMADMIYHTRLVRRGVKRALLVADMPVHSYDSPDQALENAKRLVRESGAEMVKLEGGAEVTETIRRLREQDTPVCGHLGLQPQSIEQYGGYRVQGRESEQAQRIHADALALEAAGTAMIVLECIPRALAREITAALSIPTIGIGAGVDCDGQVLVLHDVLGISSYIPKMANDFLRQGGSIRGAFDTYRHAVKARTFPGAEHSFD